MLRRPAARSHTIDGTIKSFSEFGTYEKERDSPDIARYQARA